MRAGSQTSQYHPSTPFRPCAWRFSEAGAFSPISLCRAKLGLAHCGWDPIEHRLRCAGLRRAFPAPGPTDSPALSVFARRRGSLAQAVPAAASAHTPLPGVSHCLLRTAPMPGLQQAWGSLDWVPSRPVQPPPAAAGCTKQSGAWGWHCRLWGMRQGWTAPRNCLLSKLGPG